MKDSVCLYCRGDGHEGQEPCNRCNGTGRVKVLSRCPYSNDELRLCIEAVTYAQTEALFHAGTRNLSEEDIIKLILAGFIAFKPRLHANWSMPDGVVVPAEITLPMQHAYFKVIDANHALGIRDMMGRYDNQKIAYRAMLAAAPKTKESSI